MAEERKPVCPPPLVPDAVGRCVSPGFITPFGGPASGISPLGGAIGPSGIQPASCILPNLFSECFRGCDAAGHCGWTTFVGSAVFTGRDVRLDSPGGVIFKPLTGVPPAGTTMIVRLREFDGPPIATIVYGFGALDATGNAINGVRLFGDGSVNVLLGPIVYSGSWTPRAGAFHTVVLTVAPDGTPSLFIDQVFIPLTLGGPLSPAPFGNAFALSALNFGPPAGSSFFLSAFLARGVFPPTTVFCCPDGQAP